MNNIDLVIQNIQDFNQSPLNLATDYLTARQFPDHIPGANPEMIPAMVLIIDRLWQTQLQMQPHAYEDIVNCLQESWADIRGVLENLGANDLQENPENVYEAACQVFPVILNAANNSNYVFTAKFFHWCTKVHFPIVDSRARAGVNQMVGEGEIEFADNHEINIIPPGHNPLDDYEGWVFLYSELLNQNGLDALEAADTASQMETNPSLCIDNTLLRILDKHFYTVGRN